MSAPLRSGVLDWRRCFSCSASPFSSTEKHVAHQLAQYMSSQGESAFPSTATLAKNSGHSESTVREALKTMLGWGFLMREERRGRGNTNRHSALIPAYFDVDASAEENRRAAVAFAKAGSVRAANADGNTRSETPSAAPEETAGDRRVSEIRRDDKTTGDRHENHRSPSSKPPVTGADVNQDGTTDASETPEGVSLAVTEPPDGGSAIVPFERPIAQVLVSEFVDLARERGSDPPRSVIGQFANAMKKLLDEGQPPERIRLGMARMLERGIVVPALLPNFVMEAELPLTTGRFVGAAEVLADARRLQAEGR